MEIKWANKYTIPTSPNFIINHGRLTMDIQHSNILYKKPTNDRGIYSVSCKVGRHFIKLCTLDTTRKIIFIQKNQRKYSKKLNAFGISLDLLECTSLIYDWVFVETKRKFYCIKRSFWKWNGTIIETTLRRSYLNLENFSSVSLKGGQYEK